MIALTGLGWGIAVPLLIAGLLGFIYWIVRSWDGT